MTKHRIAYIHPGRFPSNAAHTIQVMRMCEGFQQSGVRIALIGRRSVTERCAGDAERDVVFNHYGIKSRFNAHFLDCRAYEKWPAPFRNFGLMWFAYKAMRHADARAAHAIYTRDPHTALLAAITGKAFILEEHAPPLSRLDRCLRQYVYRSRSLLGVVCISKALYRIIADLALFRPSQPRVCVEHDAAVMPSAASLAALPHGRRSSNPPTVGYIGGILPGRGIELIMEVARKSQGMRFRIIGGSRDEIAPYRKTEATNLEWAGRRSPGEVAQEFSRMDVLLMPYQQDTLTRGGLCSAKWMSPLKLFEYMSSGVPVVASDLPVLREILIDGYNALLVPPADVDAWSAAVARLAASPELAARLAAQAQRDICTKHNWTDRARRVVTALLEQIPPA